MIIKKDHKYIGTHRLDTKKKGVQAVGIKKDDSCSIQESSIVRFSNA